MSPLPSFGAHAFVVLGVCIVICGYARAAGAPFLAKTNGGIKTILVRSEVRQ